MPLVYAEPPGETPTGTYLGVEGQLLNSQVNQRIGAVNLNFPPTYVPSGTRQQLDYTERNLIVTVNQLLGDDFSIGARFTAILQ